MQPCLHTSGPLRASKLADASELMKSCARTCAVKRADGWRVAASQASAG